MTLDDILALAAAGESETLELKRSTAAIRSGAQTLCAMLNHRGGRVLFGVEPDGRVVGQRVSDRTIEDLAAEIKQIDPPAFPTVDRVGVGPSASEVIVVTVSNAPSRPYTHRGIAYWRVGNTTQGLSREEYHRLLLERVHGEQRWENQLASGWTISDLDATEIVRTVEEAIRRGRLEEPATRDLGELLRGLGLVRDGNLVRAAVVLFGRPERLLGEYPQFLLRVARFAGVDKSEFRDNRQFTGHAFELLQSAERFLREHVPIAGRVVPGRFERIDEPVFPPIAVREALANAFCHRDYSLGGGSVGVALYDNRLEITSSGTLHFGLTPEALYLPHESLPWNPIIAGVFFRRGIIESWGRGTIKMVEAAEQAGLAKPVIEANGGHVVVRFQRRHFAISPLSGRALSERQRQVLDLLAGLSAGLALKDIRIGLGEGVPEWEVKNDLARLKELGLIRLEGRGRGSRWIVAND